MPSEIKTEEEFKELAKNSLRCTVKHVRKSDRVKVKLHLSKGLFTYVTDAVTAEKLLKGVKGEVEQL